MTKLNETTVRDLPAPAKGHRLSYFGDAVVQGSQVPRGLAVRVTATGIKSFCLRYHVNGRERLATIGRWPDWSVPRAVREARELRQRVDRGEDPLADRRRADAVERNTFGAIVAEYTAREGGHLRSAAWRQRALDRLVLPELGSRPVDQIKRSDVIRLFDRIEDQNGPVMSDRVLAIVRKILNWHASRSDDFRSPIVSGMARTKSKERARERILNDDELRALWSATDGDADVFGRLVRFLILTGSRRSEAAGLAWSEISGEVWTLPPHRNKVKTEFARPLSSAALHCLPEHGAGEYVFSTDGGKTPISGFSKMKRRLDQAAGVSGWRLHDCRRSARSLMSRAGVPSDHAERCLGHVMPGVRAVYDRHGYLAEMTRAYDALASLVERIVAGPVDNVTQLRGR